MKKGNRIGFFQPDDEEEPEEKKIHPFETYITDNYGPNGFAEDMEMYTTLELLSSLSEMFSIRPDKAVDILTRLGYVIKILDGEPVWLMYNKNEKLTD
jgi:hypothetical protein